MCYNIFKISFKMLIGCCGVKNNVVLLRSTFSLVEWDSLKTTPWAVGSQPLCRPLAQTQNKATKTYSFTAYPLVLVDKRCFNTLACDARNVIFNLSSAASDPIRPCSTSFSNHSTELLPFHWSFLSLPLFTTNVLLS